jgi:hypothetical protein
LKLARRRQGEGKPRRKRGITKIVFTETALENVYLPAVAPGRKESITVLVSCQGASSISSKLRNRGHRRLKYEKEKL